MTDRDKLLVRIKALFSKTTEAGATEAEELAAAEKARELIRKYQIDLGSEELKKEGFVEKAIVMEPTGFAFGRRILGGVEKFCEVKSWLVIFGSHREIVVFGLASDVELAAYLVDSLITFSLAGADVHIAVERKMAIALGTPMTAAQSREAHRSYLVGCANRISARLRELAQERGSTAKPGSYGALITLDKLALIKAEMERLNIKLSCGSGLTGASDDGSFVAGSAHGAKASFGRPIGSSRVRRPDRQTVSPGGT